MYTHFRRGLWGILKSTAITSVQSSNINSRRWKNLQEVRQEAGVVGGRRYSLLRAVTPACESAWHKVGIGLQEMRQRENAFIPPRVTTSFWHNRMLQSKQMMMSCNGWTHHGKELLRQRVMVGEELEWCGGWQGGGRLVVMVVVMVGVAEASTYWQLFSQKLNLIFDPL